MINTLIHADTLTQTYACTRPDQLIGSKAAALALYCIQFYVQSLFGRLMRVLSAKAASTHTHTRTSTPTLTLGSRAFQGERKKE